MKTAVVYYSIDGNGALVAKELIALLNADLIRLHTADEKPRKGFVQFLWGCKMMLLNKNPPLKPYSFNPLAYDLIILGSPVWGASPAPPIRSFLAEAGLSGKKVAFYLTHTGSVGKAREKMWALLAGNNIISEADFLRPLENSEGVKQQLADWVKGFVDKQ